MFDWVDLHDDFLDIPSGSYQTKDLNNQLDLYEIKEGRIKLIGNEWPEEWTLHFHTVERGKMIRCEANFQRDVLVSVRRVTDEP